jgi:hypothetical protein
LLLELRTEHGRVTLDMLLGAAVFGVVGAAIGYYWGTSASLAVATAVGLVFGFLIGLLGGRRFFVSIICGALLGAGLAWLVSGTSSIPLGAASGGAMGGFLGVQMGMLLELWRQRKETPATTPPAPDNEDSK